MHELKGLIAAPFTPLDEKGNLALSQIGTLRRLYENNGVSGAFICGSTGEGVSLTQEEKKLVMKTWGKEKGNLKTIFMLGGTSINIMKELAHLASQNNMDGISIVSPYFFNPGSVETLVSFCQEVATTAPDLPFYYYHIPAFSGGNYSMQEFLTLAGKRIPNLAGIKFSHSNIMEYHTCNRFSDGKYDILWGVDEALLSGLVIGVKGAVGSTYNYAAPLYNSIMEAFDAGDIQKAEELQFKAVQMVQLLVKYGGIGAGKAFMKLIGVDCGWFRKPIQPLSDESLQSLKVDLEKIGFFDFCSQLEVYEK